MIKMNSRDSHKDRMRWLNFIAAPLEGTPEFYRLKKQVEPNPEAAKKEVKRRWEIAQTAVRAQLNGGAGNYPDEALRTFLLQYNDRTWRHGMRRLPMSFNVLEPFFHYEADHIRWRLLPEVDYRFSIVDFLDFATQPATPEATVADAMTLEEGVFITPRSEVQVSPLPTLPFAYLLFGLFSQSFHVFFLPVSQS
jgi:hypothetical protein